MAIMYITEYGGAGQRGRQVPVEPPLAIQAVTFTTSVASAALHEDTTLVSVQLSADGHVQFAAAPTATATTSRVHKANAVSFHEVKNGLKIAALAI